VRHSSELPSAGCSGDALSPHASGTPSHRHRNSQPLTETAHSASQACSELLTAPPSFSQLLPDNYELVTYQPAPTLEMFLKHASSSRWPGPPPCQNGHQDFSPALHVKRLSQGLRGSRAAPARQLLTPHKGECVRLVEPPLSYPATYTHDCTPSKRSKRAASDTFFVQYIFTPYHTAPQRTSRMRSYV
jgi:hypothetical protein